jgi:hypothetical protein
MTDPPEKMYCPHCRQQTEVEMRDEFPAPSPSTDTIQRFQCSVCSAICGTVHRANIKPVWPQANITHRENY